MSGRYYIRVRGQKHGPLTAEQLQSLARRGRFARHYEVSTDGRNWRQAAEFPELFAKPPEEDDGAAFDGLDAELNDPPPPRPEKRRRPSSRSKDDDFVLPPPIDFDDFYPTDPVPTNRRKSGSERPSAAAPRESIPLDDGPDDDSDPEDAAPHHSVARRRQIPERRPAPYPAPAPDDQETPLWEDEEKEAPGTSRRGKKQERTAKTPAIESVSESFDDEEPEKKKRPADSSVSFAGVQRLTRNCPGI